MKNRIPLLIPSFLIFSLILFSYNVFAQKEFQLGIIYSPQLSQFHAPNWPNSNFDALFNHSIGISGRLIFPSRFYLSSSLIHRNSGASFEMEITTENMPEGTGEFRMVDWRLKSLEWVVHAGYLFSLQEKVSVGGKIGLINDLLLKQELDSTKAGLLNSYSFGSEVGIDVSILFKNKLTINFSPNIGYLFNDNIPDYHFVRYGIDLGLLYVFR